MQDGIDKVDVRIFIDQVNLDLTHGVCTVIEV